jgi:hypothetical protein
MWGKISLDTKTCLGTLIVSFERFRIDAKTEPFFMSMTIHPKFIKTELKLV